MSDGWLADVWFSPLGEKKYATTQAMATITRPTKMLNLRQLAGLSRERIIEERAR